MDISEAVRTRQSTRAFLKKPVTNKVIKELLIESSRSPSGGNLQPWRIAVLNNKSMKNFLEFQDSWSKPESSSYDIYPSKLKEPYRTSRHELGEQMYTLLGIDRENKNERLKQVMRNFKFFDAPAAIFCFIDKQMGPPQWSDLGMFLQTFMLLAESRGLNTCSQEAWAMKSSSVCEFFKIHPDEMLFCAVAIGYGDKSAVINKLYSERRPIDDWVTFF